MIRSKLPELLLSLLIFVFIFIVANTGYAVKMVPPPSYTLSSGVTISPPTGRWEYKTNSLLYLTDSFDGISTTDGWLKRPFILLYWYLISLTLASLGLKIIGVKRTK